jgi:hypothetical protein
MDATVSWLLVCWSREQGLIAVTFSSLLYLLIPSPLQLRIDIKAPDHCIAKFIVMTALKTHAARLFA